MYINPHALFTSAHLAEAERLGREEAAVASLRWKRENGPLAGAPRWQYGFLAFQLPNDLREFAERLDEAASRGQPLAECDERFSSIRNEIEVAFAALCDAAAAAACAAETARAAAEAATEVAYWVQIILGGDGSAAGKQLADAFRLWHTPGGTTTCEVEFACRRWDSLLYCSDDNEVASSIQLTLRGTGGVPREEMLAELQELAARLGYDLRVDVNAHVDFNRARWVECNLRIAHS